MTFAFPIWLVGLLPWTGLVAYLLRGGGPHAKVPFLHLWPRPQVARKTRLYRLPRIHILLMIVAALLAILAASGPTWTRGARAAGELTIVIDRGFTLSGDARYQDLIACCSKVIGPRAGVTLVPVPGQSTEVTAGSWVDIAERFPPAAFDTSAQLKIAVADRLRQTSGTVILLTDQSIALSDARLFVIRPDRPPRNIGIILLAATAEPHPQVMVRLQNHASEKIVHLRVQSGRNIVEREVHFDTDYATEFVDLPSLADVVSAEIRATDDDIPADDAAWLTRESTGITIDTAAGVPAEVQKVAAVFARHRPAGRHVLLTDHDLPADVEGAVITSGNVADLPIIALTSTNPSLASGVTAWPGPAANAKPPGDFQIALQRAGITLLAMHEAAPRQLWVNLNLTTWSRTTDFVVLFSNLFEWLRGSGSDEFVSISPRSLGPDWKRIDDRRSPADLSGLWPGLYQSVDGQVVAVNASVEAARPRVGSEIIELPTSIFSATHIGISLMPASCWAAIFMGIIAVAIWPRKNSADTFSSSHLGPVPQAKWQNSSRQKMSGGLKSYFRKRETR